MINCGDPAGKAVTLNVQTDPGYKGGDIGFFLITPEDHAKGGSCASGNCCPSVARLGVGEGYVYYSQKELDPDPGYIHLLNLPGTIAPNRFYFAWEDTFDTTSADFTDLVAAVDGVQCSGAGVACTTGKEGVCAAGITFRPGRLDDARLPAARSAAARDVRRARRRLRRHRRQRRHLPDRRRHLLQRAVRRALRERWRTTCTPARLRSEHWRVRRSQVCRGDVRRRSGMRGRHVHDGVSGGGVPAGARRASAIAASISASRSRARAGCRACRESASRDAPPAEGSRAARRSRAIRRPAPARTSRAPSLARAGPSVKAGSCVDGCQGVVCPRAALAPRAVQHARLGRRRRGPVLIAAARFGRGAAGEARPAIGRGRRRRERRDLRLRRAARRVRVRPTPGAPRDADRAEYAGAFLRGARRRERSPRAPPIERGSAATSARIDGDLDAHAGRSGRSCGSASR